jgi:cell wall-associated NlpC family hydrolase
VAKARVSRFNRALICIALVICGVLVSPLAAGAIPHLETPTASPTAASSAAAKPTTPATADEVTAKIADLATANEKLTEQFNKARSDVIAAQQASDKASAVSDKARLARSQTQRELGLLLAQRYKSPSFSRTAALFSSNSGQSYLDRIQSLQQLAAHQGELAQTASAAETAASKTKGEAQAALSAAIAQKDALVRRRADLQRQVSKYQNLLSTLTATARSAYYGSNNATAAEIAQALANYTNGATAADVLAIKAALAELGKPYVWAAAGPGSFDCSGLTMWAWAKAGVSLPHLASSQQTMGTQVDRNQLRPGDLVFFGSPAYHVALYIGSGMIIQAPNSGDVVKISPLGSMSDYSSATRIG